MALARILLAVVVASVCFVAMSPPAGACTCFGDPVRAAEITGRLPDVVFTGTVVENGDSNVTAEWSQPPRPGIALQFMVDEVRLGDIGSSVVVHTPEGPAGGGNCSVGVPKGQQLVAVHRGNDGYLTGGMCSIYPIARAPSPNELTNTFGPPRPPSADIDPELLNAGTVRAPDPEDIPAQREFAARNGQLDFSPPATNDTPTQTSVIVAITFAIAGLLAAATTVAIRRR